MLLLVDYTNCQVIKMNYTCKRTTKRRLYSDLRELAHSAAATPVCPFGVRWEDAVEVHATRFLHYLSLLLRAG
jgi:hypothetical protein